MQAIYTNLQPFQIRAQEIIHRHVEGLDKSSKLNEAYAYALTNGGKRFRPAAVFMLADALGGKYDVSQAALAIELCHTASLIADDLPMMDDDNERRSKPSLHKAYDEPTALLVSYAMIADAYAAISANARVLELAGNPLSAQIGLVGVESASYNTGLQGASGGQYLDLFPPQLSESILREIIHKKTVVLFEVAFVLGWIFGGGDLNSLDKVKKTASHFGTAFQIADDLDDLQQDAYNQHSVNYAAFCGEIKAREVFHAEIEGYYKTLKELRIDSPALRDLAQLLLQLAG
jgi:geranylgeranyl diphosphate synthase type II